MAESLDDSEFWLPSEFLPDDIFVAEKTYLAEAKSGGRGCFPREFPYDCESNLTSPVETVTETASDEECMADLTRRLARSLLCRDHDKSNYPVFSTNKGSVASSPQFPHWASGTWPAEVVPSSEVSSPDTTYDILFAAARQVVRMKQEVEANKLASTHAAERGILGLRREPSPLVSANTTGYFASNPLTHRQLQINQFYHLKHHQMLKQQLQGSGAWGKQTRRRSGMGVDVNNNSRSRGGGGGRPLGGLPPTAWSSLQQRQHSNASGMRAVFLRTPGHASRKQSCGGTGVFLPRRVGSPTDSRKKPACSTVLLPAKVVQALNLNLEDVGSQPRFLDGFILDHETIEARKESGGHRPQDTVGVNPHEVRREASWAY